MEAKKRKLTRQERLLMLKPGGLECLNEAYKYFLSTNLLEEESAWEFAYRRARKKFGKRFGRKLPESVIRSILIQSAIDCGQLKKEPCRICGTTRRVCGHHPDYNKPYEVEWLCFKHHMELHNRLQN